jgi:hypothetical protein
MGAVWWAYQLVTANAQTPPSNATEHGMPTRAAVRRYIMLESTWELPPHTHVTAPGGFTAASLPKPLEKPYAHTPPTGTATSVGMR